MHKMKLSLFSTYTPLLKEHNSITQFYQRLNITSIIVHKYKRNIDKAIFKGNILGMTWNRIVRE